jgi:hypothetical protein
MNEDVVEAKGGRYYKVTENGKVLDAVPPVEKWKGKKRMIADLLLEGKTPEEVARDLNTNILYVYQVRKLLDKVGMLGEEKPKAEKEEKPPVVVYAPVSDVVKDFKRGLYAGKPTLIAENIENKYILDALQKGGIKLGEEKGKESISETIKDIYREIYPEVLKARVLASILKESFSEGEGRPSEGSGFVLQAILQMIQNQQQQNQAIMLELMKIATSKKEEGKTDDISKIYEAMSKQWEMTNNLIIRMVEAQSKASPSTTFKDVVDLWMNNTKAWVDHYRDEIKELKDRLNFDPLEYALNVVDRLRTSGILTQPEAEQAKAELELKKKQIEGQQEIEKLKVQSQLKTQEMQQLYPLIQLFIPTSTQQGQAQIQEVKEAYKPISG